MITVTKTMTTETAHRLMDYVGKCASIHGHSYKWEVTAMYREGKMQSNGISVDFGDLKKMMRKHIYEPFDHALVLHERDPLLSVIVPDGVKDWECQKVFPFPGNPTAEHFAQWIAVRIQRDCIEQEVGIMRVRVWETENSYGEWIRSAKFGQINMDTKISLV